MNFELSQSRLVKNEKMNRIIIAEIEVRIFFD